MSFSRYNPEDSVISSETVVRGLWSGDNYTLNSSNMVTASGYTEYYLDVYNGSPYATDSSVQFTLQYGQISGSGSAPINSTVPGYSPSRVVYGEYRNLVYGTETTNFSFDGGITTANQIYVINISRANYKQALHPGSLNLTLGSGSATIQLTDDNNTTSLTRFIGENRVFYIISGSNGNAYTSSAATGPYYGIMLPDLGFIVLDASGSLTPYIQAANLSLSVQNNHLKLYNSIKSGSTLIINPYLYHNYGVGYNGSFGPYGSGNTNTSGNYGIIISSSTTIYVNINVGPAY